MTRVGTSKLIHEDDVIGRYQPHFKNLSQRDTVKRELLSKCLEKADNEFDKYKVMNRKYYFSELPVSERVFLREGTQEAMEMLRQGTWFKFNYILSLEVIE